MIYLKEKMIEKKLNIVNDYQKSNILRNLAIGIVILIVFLSLPGFCVGDCGHSHNNHVNDPHHHHHHDDYVEEPASYKWSKQANEGVNSAEDSSASHEHDHHHHHEDEHIHHHDHSHEHKHEQTTQKTKSVQGKEKLIKTSKISIIKTFLFIFSQNLLIYGYTLLVQQF